MPGTQPTISLATPPGGHLYANEAGLSQGSNPGGVATSSGWTFWVRAEDGIDDLTVAGYAAIRDGVFTPGSVTFSYGVLSIHRYDPSDGSVGVTFSLTAPYHNHPGSQGKYGDIVFHDVVLTDRDGDVARDQLLVQIRDDEAMSVRGDSATATAGGAAATGNLVANDTFTADGFGGVFKIADGDLQNPDSTPDASGELTVVGTYGVLTVHTSGEYRYVANASAPEGAADRFTYWARDGDGDEGWTWLTVRLQAGSGEPSPGGQVINSRGPGDTLVGGAGDDTLNASQGADVLTGAGGADAFTYQALPWNAGRVTDFTVGTDRLDLSAIFQAAGYSSADPVADGRVTFQADGAGGTRVYFDTDGPGGEWPFRITTLENVSSANLTWAGLQGGGGSTEPPPPPPPDEEGQVIDSRGPGDTLVGGSGDDTLNASQGPDQLTGAGGADAFTYQALPWNAGRVTDFAVGTDRLDLSAIFQAAGYSSADPVADGRVTFQSDGAGGTQVYFDTDGPGGDWPFKITTLENVSPANLTWADLQGGGGSSPPPPPDDDGEVLTWSQHGDTLAGGAGNDTLNASQGPDQLTGAGGADHFVWANLPWNAGHVTDFTPGTDVLDLSRLLQGYGGSDPQADGRLEFRGDGSGNTQVYVDTDGPGGDWPFLITTLDGVAPSQIGAGDWVI